MRGFLFAAALFAANAAPAATVNVIVRDAGGSPLADAVVTIESAATRPGTPPAYDYPLQVSQRDIQFDPYVLIVPTGARVTFPNRDRVRHQVYSFSRPKRFELKLYGREENRSILFDVAGTVALGCNIHDAMTAFVKVVDTPWAGKTDADGRVSIAGVPAGAATIRVWHPRARARNNEFVGELPVPASGELGRIVTLGTTAR